MYQNGKNIIFTDRSVGCVDNYLRSISKSKPLTNEEEYELWVRMRQGSQCARNQLVSANLRYVVSIAKKYLASKTAFEDLISAGNEGLVKAVDKFDATYGVRFISFATWYIENEIRQTAYDYIYHNSLSIDEPVDVEKKNGDNQIDFLYAEPCDASDWNLHYSDVLSNLTNHADKRFYGAGKLANNLYQMLQNGYTTTDFAHKYHLSKVQTTHLLDILRKGMNNNAIG